jgi:hypothetical protein
MSDYTLFFERDNNDGVACIDYAWIASGKRSQLILNQGERHTLKTDNIPVDQTVVNVFALTNEDVGLAAAWQSDPSQLAIKFAWFKIEGQNVVRTIFYADGSSIAKTMTLSQQHLPCRALPQE